MAVDPSLQAAVDRLLAFTAAPERLAYSPREAAELLSISRDTVYNLMRDGALPSVKLGGSRRIRRADLIALLADGTP